METGKGIRRDKKIQRTSERPEPVDTMLKEVIDDQAGTMPPEMGRLIKFCGIFHIRQHLI
jgi:hypothetical protein